MTHAPTSPEEPLIRHADSLLLAILTVARIRIDTLAEVAVLPLRQQDVARHPWLGSLLSPQAMALLAQQQTVDPIGLLLIVAAIGCLIAYLLIAEFVTNARWRNSLKAILICAIIALTVIAPSLKLALLRQGSGPASYSHDGGVIQTEAAIDYLLHGRNPYVEDYINTPMAQWGIDEFRTALYHYPYLPWTFLFAAPFKLISDALLGWYDQRFVYLLLFVLTLGLATGMARDPRRKLLILILLGLSPLLGSDLIYGQNDSFVLAWVVLSLWLWHAANRSERRRTVLIALSAVAFGLACASKPTAWFIAPFYALLIAGGEVADLWRRPAAWLRRAVTAGWPSLLVMALVIGSYLMWNAGAMFDDVWRWSSGTSDTAYQIWGWGASNLLLAFGAVQSRFAYWPFWLPELLIGVPLLIGLVKKQAGENTPARVLWGSSLLLLTYAFVSRFLNENYLSYILACIALAALIETPEGAPRGTSPTASP